MEHGRETEAAATALKLDRMKVDRAAGGMLLSAPGSSEVSSIHQSQVPKSF